MKLVVDTNVLILFFRGNPTRAIIEGSALLCLELCTPEHGFRELLSIKGNICKYSGLSPEAVDVAFVALKRHISIVPDEFSKGLEGEAKSLSPHEKDIPFFALALKLGCPIWSKEFAFKRQPKVEVFSIEELRRLLKL